MLTVVAMNAASPAWAGSVAEPALPPIARAQAERTAMTTQVSRLFEPAPTPNQDVIAPRGNLNKGTVVAPNLFRQTATYNGDGFIHGPTQQITQQSRRMQLPGISLTVPLN